MAMRRNQPKLQAKDLPVSGVTNSASFRPGEKSAISAAGICCSMGTAIARARKPAIRPSTASERNRNSLRWGIAVDSNRGFRLVRPLSCGKIVRISMNPRGSMNSQRTITFFSIIFAAVFAALIAWPRAARTRQDPTPQNKQQTPTIDEYQPKSTLVTKEHKIERAKFPFIDIHSHHWNPTREEVDRLVREMDTINLRVMVNLSGGTGEQLRNTVAVMKRRYPERFVVFANMSYDDLNTPGFGMRGAENSRADSRGGACGVFRSLGLPQRALGGVEGISGTRTATREISAVRNADDGAQSSICEAPQDKFHRGASGVSRKRPGAAGKTF